MTAATAPLNPAQKLARHVVHLAFRLSVFLIQKSCPMGPLRARVAGWERLSPETLGHQVARCLRQHSLELVPGYESHDLKHVVLGFEMTPEGETRMQAFMWGNGNRTPACLAILGFGVALMPELWRDLLDDYRRGRRTRSIVTWQMDTYAARGLRELREEIGLVVAPGPRHGGGPGRGPKRHARRAPSATCAPSADRTATRSPGYG